MQHKTHAAGWHFVILLSVTTLTAALPQDPTPFLGDWKGTIERGAKIELVFHFSLGPDKKLSGTVDIPTTGVAGETVVDLEVEGRTLSLALPNGAVLKGVLDETGKTLQMTWSRNGRDTGFTLTRTAGAKGDSSGPGASDLHR